MAKATKGERNYAWVHFVKEGTHLYASNAHVRIEKSLTDRHDVWWPSTHMRGTAEVVKNWVGDTYWYCKYCSKMLLVKIECQKNLSFMKWKCFKPWYGDKAIRHGEQHSLAAKWLSVKSHFQAWACLLPCLLFCPPCPCLSNTLVFKRVPVLRRPIYSHSPMTTLTLAHNGLS